MRCFSNAAPPRLPPTWFITAQVVQSHNLSMLIISTTGGIGEFPAPPGTIVYYSVHVPGEPQTSFVHVMVAPYVDGV